MSRKDLLRRISDCEQCELYDSALLLACEMDDLEKCKELIERGANNLVSAVCESAEHNSMNVLQYLVETYADTMDDDFPSWDSFAIHEAARGGATEACRYLFNKNYYTASSAIGLAYKNNHWETAKVLVDNGLCLEVYNDEVWKWYHDGLRAHQATKNKKGKGKNKKGKGKNKKIRR